MCRCGGGPMARVADAGSRTHRTALTSFRRCPRRPRGVACDHAFADILAGRGSLDGGSRLLGARGDAEVRPVRTTAPPRSRQGAWAQRDRPEPPFVGRAATASALRGRPPSSAPGSPAPSAVHARGEDLRGGGSHSRRRPAALAQQARRHRCPTPSWPQCCSPPDQQVRARYFRTPVRTADAPANADTSLLGRALAKGDLGRR
jgi:hypothetical protein